MPLKKEIGLFELTLSGIGVILGAGIYALVGKAAGVAGDQVWISFAVAGFIAIVTGLSYSELSSRFPKAGAEYVYTKSVFSNTIAFAVGVALLIVGITSTAAVAMGFGGYLSALTGWPMMVGIFGILLLSFIIIWFGAKISTVVAGLLSLVEMGGLVAIILIGLPHIEKGFTIPNEILWAPILSATALIFFAYLGFEDLVRLSEETKNSSKIMPKALMLAIIVSTILYILVAAAAVGILGGQALGTSTAPLADVAAQGFGPEAFFVLAVVALFSTGNTALLLLLAVSRLVYGMATEKTLPRVLGVTHNNQPINALVFAFIASLLITFLGDISFIAHVTDGLLFAVFAVMNAVVILLNYRKIKAPKGTFRVPWQVNNIPIPAVIGMITSTGMLWFVERDALFVGALLMVFGTSIYYVGKQQKWL